ncbi:hypothetical protein NRK67_03520 [Fusobacteria bacterium ZRK30]|nr:hypothetical protein NRK67_03520 [Fusobacteria bacterium ZRK30]
MEPKFITRLVITLITILMLFGNLLDGLPNGYFNVLRIIVCGAAVYRAILSFEDNHRVWGRIFIGIALLFNPIRPVHLTQELWLPIDILTGLIMLASISIIKKKKKSA